MSNDRKTLGQSLKIQQAKSLDSSSKPGKASKPESKFLSVLSNGTHRDTKIKHGNPSDRFTRVSSSTSGRALASPKNNRSIMHTFSRAASAPEGPRKIKHLFLVASSAPFCAPDEEGLSAFETLENLGCIVSSGAGSSSYHVPLIVGQHSVQTRIDQWRADQSFVVKEKRIKNRLSQHHSLPTNNAAANIVNSQDLMNSNARKKTATRTSSSEMRGTRQMVAFCETERLKARFLSVQAHSGMQSKSPAKSSRSPKFDSVWQTWLIVLCMLLATLWIFFFGL